MPLREGSMTGHIGRRDFITLLGGAAARRPRGRARRAHSKRRSAEAAGSGLDVQRAFHPSWRDFARVSETLTMWREKTSLSNTALPRAAVIALAIWSPNSCK